MDASRIHAFLSVCAARQERSWHGARCGWTAIISTREGDVGGVSLFLAHNSNEFSSSLSAEIPALASLADGCVPTSHQEGHPKFVSGSRALPVRAGDGTGSGFDFGHI